METLQAQARKMQIEEAKTLLKRLQNGEVYLFDSFIDKLKRNNIQPAEIGFTKAVFDAIWRRFCTIQVKSLLDQLCQTKDGKEFEKICENLFLILADERLSLNDFNSHGVNLIKIRAIWRKKAEEATKLARKSLARLREGVYGYDKFLLYIHNGEKNSFYTLVKIGTSVGELQGLRVACCKKRAGELLKRLRQSPNSKRRREIYEALRAELAKCELEPVNIGATEKELASLAAE
jgi:hypothetical protein